MPAEPLFVRVENDLVLARHVDPDPVVDEGFLVMDCRKVRRSRGSAKRGRQGTIDRAAALTVEDEEQPSTFKDQHLVSLVLERDVGL